MKPLPHDETALAESTKRKAYLNVVLPAFIISIIAYLDRNNLSYAKLTMLEDLGFSEKAYGFGAGIFFAGYLLFEIPGALIAEKYSAKLWIARIMITWGVLTALMAFISNETQFYLLRFMIGVAEASLYPVLFATLIPRWFVAKDRARALALMLGSLPFSSVIGAPLAGWLIDVPMFGFQGWQVLFLVEAVPAILMGFVVVYWIGDSPKTAWWLSEAERNYILRMREQEAPMASESAHYTIWQALADREVLKLCLTYFLWLTGYWGFNYYTPSLLKEAHWENQTVGWLLAAAMFAALIAMMWLGHHSSQTGEKRWHGASCMFLASLGMCAGPLISDPYISYVFLCFAGIGVYAAMGVWWSYPTTFLRGTAAAGAVGLINSVGNLGGFLGPYLTGLLKDLTGTFWIAWIFMSGSLFAAGCMILTFRVARSSTQ